MFKIYKDNHFYSEATGIHTVGIYKYTEYSKWTTMNKLPTKHLQHLHTKLMYLRDTSCIQLSRNIRFKTWTQTSKYFFKGNFWERINLVVRVTCELLKAPVLNYLTPRVKELEDSNVPPRWHSQPTGEMKKLHCIYIAPSYTPPYTY